MLERSREDVFEKGGGMRTLTPPGLESCTSETVQRKAVTWDKASEVRNSRPDTDFFVCKAREMSCRIVHVLATLGVGRGVWCAAPEEGVAAEGLRLSVLGWRVLRAFLVRERDRRKAWAFLRQ